MTSSHWDCATYRRNKPSDHSRSILPTVVICSLPAGRAAAGPPRCAPQRDPPPVGSRHRTAMCMASTVHRGVWGPAVASACRAMITRDDTERGGRLLARLMEEVGHRQGDLGPSRLLVRHRAAPHGEAGGPAPWMLLLVDGWEGFQAAYESIDSGRPIDLMVRLLRGRVCGRSPSPPHRRSLRADGTGGCALDGAADPADGRSCGLLRCGNCVPTRSRQHAARARPHARWARRDAGGAARGRSLGTGSGRGIGHSRAASGPLDRASSGQADPTRAVAR